MQQQAAAVLSPGKEMYDLLADALDSEAEDSAADDEELLVSPATAAFGLEAAEQDGEAAEQHQDTQDGAAPPGSSNAKRKLERQLKQQPPGPYRSAKGRATKMQQQILATSAATTCCCTARAAPHRKPRNLAAYIAQCKAHCVQVQNLRLHSH
jgi:hypothetical protein